MRPAGDRQFRLFASSLWQHVSNVLVRPAGDTQFRLLALAAVPVFLASMYLPASARFFQLVPLTASQWLVVLAVVVPAVGFSLLSDCLLPGSGHPGAPNAPLDEIDFDHESPSRGRAQDFTLEASQRAAGDFDGVARRQPIFRRYRRASGDQTVDLAQVRARAIADRPPARYAPPAAWSKR